MHFTDFPIDSGNPRNSEGSFLTMGNKDDFLFAYPAFSGEKVREFTKANINSKSQAMGNRFLPLP